LLNKTNLQRKGPAGQSGRFPLFFPGGDGILPDSSTHRLDSARRHPPLQTDVQHSPQPAAPIRYPFDCTGRPAATERNDPLKTHPFGGEPLGNQLVRRILRNLFKSVHPERIAGWTGSRPRENIILIPSHTKSVFLLVRPNPLAKDAPLFFNDWKNRKKRFQCPEK
jgi:hypothetical protein